MWDHDLLVSLKHCTSRADSWGRGSWGFFVRSLRSGSFHSSLILIHFTCSISIPPIVLPASLPFYLDIFGLYPLVGITASRIGICISICWWWSCLDLVVWSSIFAWQWISNQKLQKSFSRTLFSGLQMYSIVWPKWVHNSYSNASLYLRKHARNLRKAPKPLTYMLLWTKFYIVKSFKE